MKKLVLIFLFSFSSLIIAQDFLMQAWYWDYPKTIDDFNWADTLTDKSQELADAGFTYIWLPPLSRASFGNGSNGYDPQDLYDLGEYGGGATGFGTRTDVDEVITEFTNVGINAVADVVYNHRDGGKAEDNPAVKNYVLEYTSPPKTPYPSDRYRITLDVGGSSPFSTGDYYFKVSSKSDGYSVFGYKVYMTTDLKKDEPYQGSINETEPNGGGDCGQDDDNETVILNQDIIAMLGNDIYGCGTDEFHLSLTSADFSLSGDKLIISLTNTGGYSDHRIYKFYYDPEGPTGGIDYYPEDLAEFNYQSYTDFSELPSLNGEMNWTNFKPNLDNMNSLNGDQDYPFFFYDYDQNVVSTKNVLHEWTKWLMQDVGIKGLRMDAVKHFPPSFIGELFNFLHNEGFNPQLTVGESFDFNAGNLAWWINSVYSSMNEETKNFIVPRIFDFSLRGSFKNVCDGNGDARDIFNSSIVDATGLSGYNVVTFVGNHDFRDAGQYIENDHILAYAYILTNNQIGLPSIFYPDYYTVDGYATTGEKTNIDKLLEVHKKYITGLPNREYLSNFGTLKNPYSMPGTAETDKALIYQLLDDPIGSDVIVAINFDDIPLDMWIGINDIDSRVPEGTMFFDVIGNGTSEHFTVTTDGRINVQLPPKSYSVWIEGLTVQAKIFLEGSYSPSTNLMSTSLNDNNKLPFTSPYSEDLRTATSIDDSITDWILLELYDELTNEPVVSKSVFVRNDGMLVLEDGITTQIPLDAGNGNYHIVLKHRNHLAVASSNKIFVSSATPLFDFTTVSE